MERSGGRSLLPLMPLPERAFPGQPCSGNRQADRKKEARLRLFSGFVTG